MTQAAVAARRNTRHGSISVTELLALHGSEAAARAQSTRRAVAVTGSGAVFGALVAAAVALSGPAAGPTPVPAPGGNSEAALGPTVTMTGAAQPSAVADPEVTSPISVLPADAPVQRARPPAVATRSAEAVSRPAPATSQVGAEPETVRDPAGAPEDALDPLENPVDQFIDPIGGLLTR